MAQSKPRAKSEHWKNIERRLVKLLDFWNNLDPDIREALGSRGYGAARKYVVVCLKNYTMAELEHLDDHFVHSLFLEAVTKFKERELQLARVQTPKARRKRWRGGRRQ